MNTNSPPSEFNGKIIKRIVICSLILFVGIFGMIALGKLKKPPASAKPVEKSLRVETTVARSQDVQVKITGHGEVRPLNVVTVSPEVTGRIVSVHPKLEVGETIGQGEILFEVDSRDYRAARDEAKAAVMQAENSVARLKKQAEIDQQRLKTLERSRDLAHDEYQRLKELYENQSIGTRSGSDQAEQAYNLKVDLTDQLAQAIALYPLQIKEADGSLAATRARLSTAETRLERCQAKAPFTGRVKEVTVEAGQFVEPAHKAVTLSDDSILEIHVSIDSVDAAQWLMFTPEKNENNTAWFNAVKPVTCLIQWTENNTVQRKGTLDRVVAFDAKTRTLTLAIRLSGNTPKTQGLPLVAGMFCSVTIPGRTLTDVFRLPRWAVSFENTVFVAQDNRLKTVKVQVSRSEGEETLVSAGLTPGDQVVITRLVNPLENSLLKIVPSQGSEN